MDICQICKKPINQSLTYLCYECLDNQINILIKQKEEEENRKIAEKNEKYRKVIKYMDDYPQLIKKLLAIYVVSRHDDITESNIEKVLETYDFNDKRTIKIRERI
jgi:hypothetical protein